MVQKFHSTWHCLRPQEDSMSMCFAISTDSKNNSESSTVLNAVVSKMYQVPQIGYINTCLASPTCQKKRTKKNVMNQVTTVKASCYDESTCFTCNCCGTLDHWGMIGGIFGDDWEFWGILGDDWEVLGDSWGWLGILRDDWGVFGMIGDS